MGWVEVREFRSSRHLFLQIVSPGATGYDAAQIDYFGHALRALL